MAKFRFEVPEIHHQVYEIECDDIKDVAQLWKDGAAEAVDDGLEYSRIDEDYVAPNLDEVYRA